HMLTRRTLRSTLFPYTTLFRSAGDHMIIRSIEANELMKENIVSKPHFHFWQDKFEFTHNTSGNIPDEYLDFKPNDFLAQIFSKPERKSTRLHSSHVKNSYAVFC